MVVHAYALNGFLFCEDIMNKLRVVKCSCGCEIEYYQKDTYKRFWRIENGDKHYIRFINCPKCKIRVRTDNKKVLTKAKKGDIIKKIAR